jgi:putative transposase
VCRDAERNGLRAGLVRRAEAWRWCSLFRWQQGSAREKSLLAAWPLPRRPGWIEHVNRPPSEAELAAIRRGVPRAVPSTLPPGPTASLAFSVWRAPFALAGVRGKP